MADNLPPNAQKTKKEDDKPDIKDVPATVQYVKVKMRVNSASPDGVMESEKVYRISREQAEEFIAGGYAELSNEPVYDPR